MALLVEAGLGVCQFIAWRVGWLARARRVEQLVGPLKLAKVRQRRSLANARID